MKTKPPQDFPDTTPKPSHGAGETALVLAVLAAATVWGIPLAILLGLAAIAYGVLGLRERGQRVPVLIGLGLGAATAAVGCGVLVWFLDGLSHPYGPLPGELLSQGGVYKAPLGPGKTARYRDGVKVTVSEARRVPHLTGDL